MGMQNIYILHTDHIRTMDNDPFANIIGLPFYQQSRVAPLQAPSSQRRPPKRKRTPENQENLNHCIRESLIESMGPSPSSDISFGGSVVPLPGFDDKLSCKLCQLKTAQGVRASSDGATIGEFLNIAHERFDQEEGRPAMDMASEIRESLLIFNQQCDIPVLRDITDEDVYRHFKFDHMRRGKPHMKDKMLRTLMSMLDVSVLTCCEKSEDGKVVINKNDASLTLSIIDRIHKIATLKELD